MEHKYIDADASRNEFMEAVYDILTDDSTNDRANEIIDVFDTLPAADVEPVRKWTWCGKKLPENAKDRNAFRPKYQIYTSYGITEGWYGWFKEEKGWYALIWFMDERYHEWNIDFERGDVPKVTFIPDGGKVKVYAWREWPEPPKMDGGSE